MKTLEEGKKRIQDICDAIRRDTIEPAKEEARRIVEEGERIKHELIEEGRKEKERQIGEAQALIEQKWAVFQSSIEQASKQAVESLKQKIEKELFSPHLAELLRGSMSEPLVVAHIVDGLVKALDKEGLAVNLAAEVGRNVDREEVNKLLAKRILEQLEHGTVSIGDFEGGAKIALKEGNMSVALTLDDARKLLAEYLRKDFRKLIFAEYGSMTNYYFVTSALPSLQLGMQPEISYQEFSFLLDVNLTEKDLRQVRVLRRRADVENVKNYLQGEPLDPRGNWSRMELEEALAGVENLPPYFYDFLHQYDTPELRLKNYPSLLSGYYRYEAAHAKGFLKELLQFDRRWRLVFTAMRAKALGRDLSKELQFEDADEDFVAQLLVQKDAPSFEPPDGYEALKSYYEEFRNDPLGLLKALQAWRFNKIEEMLGTQQFSIDRILGYMEQLVSLEQWSELDHVKGQRVVEAIIKEPK